MTGSVPHTQAETGHTIKYQAVRRPHYCTFPKNSYEQQDKARHQRPIRDYFLVFNVDTLTVFFPLLNNEIPICSRHPFNFLFNY
jgi:hypothetical protein